MLLRWRVEGKGQEWPGDGLSKCVVDEALLSSSAKRALRCAAVVGKSGLQTIF